MEDKPTNTSNPNAKTNLDELLNQFNNTTDRAIAECWFKCSDEEHLSYLLSSAKEIVDEMAAIGDHAYQQVESNGYSLVPATISYQWGEYAKAYALLWRDILFQHQNALLKLDSNFQSTEFQELKTESLRVLQNATKEVQNFFQNAPSKIASNPTKQLEKWKLQDNPWPVYKEQLLEIPKQSKKIFNQSNTLQKTAVQYQLISKHFKDTFEGYAQHQQALQVALNGLLESLNQEPPISSNQVVSEMESLHKKLQSLDGLVEFKDELNDFLANLANERKYYVGIDEGMLLFKEIDLEKSTRAWLESEVIPGVYELSSIQEQIKNKIGLSIVNIRNRINAEHQDDQTTGQQEIEQTIRNFSKSLEKSSLNVLELKKHSEEKLDNELDILKIYDEDFLPLSMQQTINQYRSRQRQSLTAVTKWLNEKGTVLQQFRRNVRQEEALSISEKIVRVVKHRTPDVENSHYTNMFLTEGWIGDSFVVGRDEELEHIASLIENWQLGFRGDVLITGQRFSGKTLFGELVNHKFFNNKGIELSPGKKIQIAGRPFEVTHDLEEALKFIVKYTLNSPTMVWIDNLEYWATDKIPLIQNVKSLLSTIDQYTGRIFFVVSMSNWLKAHLNQIFEIDKVFQSEINMDNLTTYEVEQAIFIRHSATNMDLLNKEEEEITATQFKQLCRRIYRQSNGSIGEALHQWAFAIAKFDNDRLIEKKGTNNLLPDFIGQDAGLLLQSIMMSKTTNDFQLRKVFGPAFNEQYKIILQRLINLGVLTRKGTTLEINPFLANDIGQQLGRKFSFHFDKEKDNDKNIKL